jgi:hypothetical protein
MQASEISLALCFMGSILSCGRDRVPGLDPNPGSTDHAVFEPYPALVHGAEMRDEGAGHTPGWLKGRVGSGLPVAV